MNFSQRKEGRFWKTSGSPAKIRVGRLPSEGLTEKDIADHFSKVTCLMIAVFHIRLHVKHVSLFQFGCVDDVYWPREYVNSNVFSNYCFVTFNKEETARLLVEQGFTYIGDDRLVLQSVSIRTIKPQRLI